MKISIDCAIALIYAQEFLNEYGQNQGSYRATGKIKILSKCGYNIEVNDSNIYQQMTHFVKIADKIYFEKNISKLGIKDQVFICPYVGSLCSATR